MQAQAEAFAAAIGGEAQQGAGGEDAVAALTAAESTAQALTEAEAPAVQVAR
jgi:predicted dehydrogenase